MKVLINLLFWAISAMFIVVPIVTALVYSPLCLLLLILTFPFAVITFYIGIVF